MISTVPVNHSALFVIYLVSLNTEMEDEGYTSPPEEFDAPKEVTTTTVVESIHPEKHPSCIRRGNQSWDDLRLRKTDADVKQAQASTRVFLTDNQVDFVDAIWRLAPVQNDSSGSLAAIKSSMQEPVYIPMSGFISKLFLLLTGKESSCFFYDPENDLFKRNPYILIKGLSPTALDNYSQMFIECGGRFRKFLMFTKVGQVETDYIHLLCGDRSMLNGFQRTVKQYLSFYETILIVNQHSMTTFTKLQTFITVI